MIEVRSADDTAFINIKCFSVLDISQSVSATEMSHCAQ